VGVGVLVIVVAAIAAVRLAGAKTGSRWIPVYQDVLKTSFQALAIGALGGLAKLVFDRRKAGEAEAAKQRRREEARAKEEQQRAELAMADARTAAAVAETELRDRRYRFITSLVELARTVDEARLVIRANRSVRSWTDVTINRIIHARSKIRYVIHELQNWADAGSHVFDHLSDLDEHLDKMDKYLVTLLDEFAGNKQDLGELQAEAEAAKGNRRERDRLLNELWSKMTSLEHFGDLINDGPEYGDFRQDYQNALLTMRKSLAPNATAGLAKSSGPAVTTPSSSNPR
jgi:hypothetical protein